MSERKELGVAHMTGMAETIGSIEEFASRFSIFADHMDTKLDRFCLPACPTHPPETSENRNVAPVFDALLSTISSCYRTLEEVEDILNRCDV